MAPFLEAAGLIEPGAAAVDQPTYPRIHEATALLKDRIRTLAEAPDLMSYFLVETLPEYDPALLVPKKSEPAQVRSGLEAVSAWLATGDLSDLEGTETALRAIAETQGLKAGQLFMPIRVAITGRTESPGLFETVRAIGQPRVQSRIETALTLL